MKEEIKEILECIKDKKRDYVGTNGCLYQDLDRKELNLLLDYIINLQEEIEKLTAESTEWESKFYDLQKGKIRNYVRVQYIYLQQRIDKAIEVLKLCNSKCSKQVINILNGDEE